MHFGAAIRDVLSATYGSDLRHAKAQAVLPATESPQTLALLAANLELAFGVTVPAHELARLTTVRDVLQCVRLRRWAKGVESGAPRATIDPSGDAHTAAGVAGATQEPYQGAFRFTRRNVVPPPTAPGVGRAPATSGLKRS
jgi:hypothetical protein